MNEDVSRLLTWAHRAHVAWDQYNIQRRLPDDPHPQTQGAPWDSYNSELRAPRLRRNPQTMSAAWNDLETALVELSFAAGRVRGALGGGTLARPPRIPYDKRVGAYSAQFDAPFTRRVDETHEATATTLVA